MEKQSGQEWKQHTSRTWEQWASVVYLWKKPVSQKKKLGHTQDWQNTAGAFPSGSLVLGSIGFERELRDTRSTSLTVVLSGQRSLMTSWWKIRLQNCIFLPSMPVAAAECHYSQQDKVAAKCHQSSFLTLTTRWCKWWHQVRENKERSLFISVVTESTASRNPVGMDFEDILTNHWETKSSLSCNMWADNCLSVSHPSKWHCFYNIFVPVSLKHWLVMQKS